MQEERLQIGRLLAKYPNLTEDERKIFDEWLSKSGNKKHFENASNQEHKQQVLARLYELSHQNKKSWDKFSRQMMANAEPVSARNIWSARKRYMVAASVILAVISIGLYLYRTDATIQVATEASIPVQANDAEPGTFRAKLTLDDGSIIILDSAGTGQLATQGQTAIINKDGQLEYRQVVQKANKVLYNKLTTGRGDMYCAILSDESKVWLNAGSSIRYPVSFTGKERRVEINGEAYLEVAKNATMPFHVTGNGVDVEVLGTKFVINNYVDETQIKTTLLEGSVKVGPSNKNYTKILKPGEQAIIDNNSRKITVKETDATATTSWVDGRFYFDNATLEEVMRQLSRWYDVDVTYETQASINSTFKGKIERNIKLSKVLEQLQMMDENIKFGIKDKLVIVGSK